MLTFNEALYQKRKEKGLSLIKASRKIGVWPFVLAGAESGYYHLTKKQRARASELYGIDVETLYKDTYAYTKPIKEKPPKEHKLFTKIGALPQKRWFRIIIVCLLGASVVGLSVTFGIREIAYHNEKSFFENEYVTYYDSLCKYTKAGPLGGHSYTKEFDSQEESIKNYVVYEVNENSFYSYSTRAYYFDLNNETSFVLQYSWEHAVLGNVNLHFEYYDSLNTLLPSYRGYFRRENQEKISPIRLMKTGNVDIEKDTEEYNKVVSLVNSYLPCAENLITEGLNKDFAINVSAYKFFYDTATSLGTLTFYQLPVPLYSSAVSIIVFTLLTVWCYWALIKKTLKLKKLEQNLEDVSFIPDSVNVNSKPLPKDWKFYPLIKERTERFLGLLLLALGGAGTIITSVKALTGVNVFFESGTYDYSSVLLLCTPISFILLLFQKLNIMSKNKNVAFTVLMFLFFGLIFYVLEAMTIGLIAYKGLLPQSLKEKLLSFVIPGNFFLGLATYYAMSMFLFTTPKKFTKKGQIVCWRLLSILPVMYFLTGYALALLKKQGFVLSPYVQCIFIADKPIVSLFAFGLLFAKFVLTRCIYKKYGKENGELYLTGNRFAWIYNLIAVGLFVLCNIVAYILIKVGVGTGSFSLENNIFTLLIIPLMLLCSQKKQKRAAVGDTIYLVVFTILSMLPLIVVFGIVSSTIMNLIYF